MESPTTNLTLIDPNPPVHISAVMVGLRRELEALREMTPERAQALANLKARLGIPETARLSTLAIALLSDYEKQSQACPECGGKLDQPCRKVVLGEGYEPYTIPCPLQSTYRAARRAAKLMESAQIPRRYRNIRAGADFRVTDGNRLAVLAAERCIDDNAGLYVYGAAGCGKTMLACVIANERARIGKPSLFVTVPDMLEELRDFDAPAARAAKLRLLYETPCLIIDDLGAEKATAWAAEQLFRVFNARYNAELQTIITSNFALDKIAARLPNYTGERIARRIREICNPVYMS